MRQLLFIVLVGFSSAIFSASDLSLQLLNSSLKNNYSFKERSLDPNGLKIEESSGEILFNASGFTVLVATPFKERYEITQDLITIIDLDLNQSQTINLDDLNSIFIKALLSGINDKSPEYSVTNDQPNILALNPADNSSAIQFIFNQDILEAIRYTDNLGVEHSIELTLL